MSIWTSIGSEDLLALDGEIAAANYRAEGEPTIIVDVAASPAYHDHTRLSAWDTAGGCYHSMCSLLLSPNAVLSLILRLGEALKTTAAATLSEAQEARHRLELDRP